jgi:hypothetical protein
VAVLQLQDQGKLHIDDPAATHLPFFAVVYPSAASEQIMIRQLLNHSSGIPNNLPALVGWIHHAGQPSLDQTAISPRCCPAMPRCALNRADNRIEAHCSQGDYIPRGAEPRAHHVQSAPARAHCGIEDDQAGTGAAPAVWLPTNPAVGTAAPAAGLNLRLREGSLPGWNLVADLEEYG